jgi:hypothetical protein
MLTAAYLRAFALTVPEARKLGLVGHAAGLWARATRNATLWAPHEAACHALVRRAMADLPRRRIALVLGSGLARDIPLDEMAGAFEQVLLVDAVHLPLPRLTRHRNVTRLARDVTGLGAWLTGSAAGPVDALADLIARPEIDLVVSANLLSQLPFAIEDRIATRPTAFPATLPAQAIGRHVADLARFAGRVCLLTDTKASRRRDGRDTDPIDLLRGHRLPPPDETWDWIVDRSRDGDAVHRVAGYADFRAAAERIDTHDARR